jgi:hypothetical protein
MTEWIDFAVNAALVTAIWFVVPAATSRVVIATLTDRNPAWLAAHPEAVIRLERSGRVFAHCCRIWGTLSLALLTALQAGLWPRPILPLSLDTEQWKALRDVNAVLIVAGFVWVSLWMSAFFLWLRRHVSLPEERRAALEPRSMDDLASRKIRLAVQALAVLSVSAWIAAGVVLRPPLDFWSRLTMLAAALLFAHFVTRYTVSARPTTLDHLAGESYRRFGVRFGLAVQAYLLVWGALHLADAIGAPLGFDVDRATHLWQAAFLAVVLIALTRGSYSPPDSRGSSRGPREQRATTGQTRSGLMRVFRILMPARNG